MTSPWDRTGQVWRGPCGRTLLFLAKTAHLRNGTLHHRCLVLESEMGQGLGWEVGSTQDLQENTCLEALNTWERLA